MNDINLRSEVNYLINSYGITILYIRNSKYMKCKCYDELYKSGDHSCEVCFGTGKITSIEPIKCFYNNNSYYSKLSGAGKYNVDIGQFVFKHDSKVDFNDLILIVGYNGDKIVDVKQVYKINNINEIRCDDGRIEFYEVDVMTDNTLFGKFNNYVKYENLKLSKFNRMSIGRWENDRK